MTTPTPTRPRWFLACALLGLAVATAARAADAPRTDTQGDPLPEGVLARLGTVRWRAGSAIAMTAFLPDGKSVLTVSQDYVAQVWDRDTGKELRHFDAAGPVPTDVNAPRVILLSPSANAVVLSSDGKSLACGGRDGAVRVWEVATGKEVRKVSEGRPAGRTQLAFTADGKTLAVAAYTQKITLWDVADGKELRSFGGNDPSAVTRLMPYKLAFSPDGKTLVQGGLEAGGGLKPALVVWDAANGKEVRRVSDTDLGPGIAAVLYGAISPDAKIVALLANDKVKLLDLTTGKDLRQLDSAGPRTMLLFTADGKSLIGMAGRNEALTVWDVETGKILRQFGKAEGPPAAAASAVGRLPYGLSVSPDGKLLAWGDGPAVRLVDLATGKEKNAAAGHAAALRDVRFARDGKTLLTWADDTTIRRWDAATGKGVGQIAVPSKSHLFALPSPDERVLAAGDGNGTVHLLDAATGKEKHALKPDQPVYGQTVAFSPDSRLLAAVSTAAQAVRLYDVATGKEKHALPLPSARRAPGGVLVGGIRPPRRVVFSPDGRLVAATDGNVILWDVATGREVRQLAQPREVTVVRDIVFSPDGRTVAVDTNVGEIGVWEVASGQKRLTLNPLKIDPAQAQGYILVPAYGVNPTTLAFSPDGRLLVQADDRKARLWDVQGGKEVGVFDGHRSSLFAVAFAPDGKRLATVSTDTTGLVWDAEPAVKKLTAPDATLPKEKLDAVWADLGGADGAKAYDAVRALAGDPAQAVPFLAGRVKPAAPPDAKRAAKLIADLDGEEFQQREAAHKELEKLGELALPALREALKGSPSAEQRRALEELVGGAAAQGPSGERLRLLRALEALELAGTPEAVKVLKGLAAGAPDALPTTQAQAILERLGQK